MYLCSSLFIVIVFSVAEIGANIPRIKIYKDKFADQIIVIDRGTVIERGTHEELLEKKGFYAGLVSPAE